MYQQHHIIICAKEHTTETYTWRTGHLTDSHFLTRLIIHKDTYWL